MLNLDTHIFIAALEDQLLPREKKILQIETWGISAIVLWEITKLFQLKRIQLNLYAKSFQEVLSEIKIFPLDFEVCRATLGLDFKSDPADEMIAATSIVYEVPLMTRDKKILRSKIVPLVNFA